MDGSNVCMESTACYARSHADTPRHPSFDMFKAYHATVKHLIPEGMQVFGEWLYAKHSIHYTALPHYFMVFGVREGSLWASWEEVEMWAKELGVPTVPVLNQLICVSDREILKLDTPKESTCGSTCEGFVVRWASDYRADRFNQALAKFVRSNHVQTLDHWKNQEIVRNLLRTG
jgi:hypothetical protein